MFYILCFCLWFSQCYSNLNFFPFSGFCLSVLGLGFLFSFRVSIFCAFSLVFPSVALCVSVLRFGLCVFVHFINNQISDGCEPIRFLKGPVLKPLPYLDETNEN